MSELKQAVELLRKLLTMAPRGYCENFHHKPSERHELGERCPVAERYNAKLDEAQAFVRKHTKTK